MLGMLFASGGSCKALLYNCILSNFFYFSMLEICCLWFAYRSQEIGGMLSFHQRNGSSNAGKIRFIHPISVALIFLLGKKIRVQSFKSVFLVVNSKSEKSAFIRLIRLIRVAINATKEKQREAQNPQNKKTNCLKIRQLALKVVELAG